MNNNQYYKKYNNQYNGRIYKSNYRTKYRGMSNNTFKILWTFIWLAFIAALCFIFNNSTPIYLLFIWFTGIIGILY